MDRSLLDKVSLGDIKALARSISLIENEVADYQELLTAVKTLNTPVIGITGPPGAGKSTITDGLINEFVQSGKRLAILCVDPSSPFHQGALLGDRVRMNRWYLHNDVFIRSFASRGSLGGLNPRIIEIIEFLKSARFDLIIVETVGVGQSEVDIAGLADFTIVVLVPEAGDEVQAMKAGLMEIADLFVVNKSDRPDAAMFSKNLRSIIPHDASGKSVAEVINTVATTGEGLKEITSRIAKVNPETNHRKSMLYTEKAFQLIQEKRMKGIDRQLLKIELDLAMQAGDFNLYKFIRGYK